MSHFEFGGDWEVREADIPVPSARRAASHDPRDPQITLHRTYGQSMSVRNDFEAHEIVILAHDHALTLGELKSMAAAYRKLDPRLERIVMSLSPENYRENVNALQHLRFERDITREDAMSRDFVVVRQCRVKKPATSKSLDTDMTADEKIAHAKRLTGTLKSHPEPATWGDFRPTVRQ